MATDTIMNGVFTPTVFSKLMRRNLDPQSVFYDLVNRDYEGEIKNKGDKVIIVLFVYRSYFTPMARLQSRFFSIRTFRGIRRPSSAPRTGQRRR